MSSFLYYVKDFLTNKGPIEKEPIKEKSLNKNESEKNSPTKVPESQIANDIQNKVNFCK